MEVGATFAAPSGETKSTTLVFFTPVSGAFVLFVFDATSSGEAAGVFVLGNFIWRSWGKGVEMAGYKILFLKSWSLCQVLKLSEVKIGLTPE